MSYMILLYFHYYQVRHIMIKFLNAISFIDKPVRRPPFNIQEGGGGWSFCREQIIYFNQAWRGVENFAF